MGFTVIPRRLPLPDAQGYARTKGLIHKNMIMARTCDSAAEALEFKATTGTRREAAAAMYYSVLLLKEPFMAKALAIA